MTHDEIENMPAGRLMDIAIEVDVFKTENIVHPHYSTDIAAAWLVVTK